MARYMFSYTCYRQCIFFLFLKSTKIFQFETFDFKLERNILTSPISRCPIHNSALFYFKSKHFSPKIADAELFVNLVGIKSRLSE